ncbi:ammonium transporter [Bernardetia litoralis DSM 6794]|uniref:Ammonium transporter n=1 Tax=Bernardetia litoralis (strain ATCC 23117 / DSM 6794 / NBRC 15988 / NCIMB 1366 / Fx l1 / Sio-4) TaxID=880071 RepID=I4AMR3_BERLS|nr:ammonium transporter [Bernardetia litoralis]AFM05248.1 ammonium transporter [Bernardetia litoralis DSM 6794]
MISTFKKVSLSILLALLPFFAFAQQTESTPTINTGDTAWVLIATALVMLMTPAGLALFYGGLSHSKNTLNTVGMSYVSFCVASVAWVIVGYSLAFSEGNGLIGYLDNIFLENININEIADGTSIPKLLFVVFQGTFAAIAVAIVSGSVVERVKFSFWLVFSFLWILIVYSPITHWVWGGGFLSNSGELDFAGGTVIHINAGVAGLVLALLLGKRKDFGKSTEMPISLTLTVIGSALLWFGWFGFNAGSALGANGTAANALLVTNVAASIGGLSWIAIEWINKKKPSLLGVASGAVSGLVGITPACGYVSVSGALAIGLISGIIGYYGVIKLKKILNYDDTLDAFGIHGLVGIWGSLAAGIFANPAINADAVGALYGNFQQLGVQLLAVLVVIAYSAIATTIVYFVSSFFTKGARVDETMEKTGLDEAYHGERGFNIQ